MVKRRRQRRKRGEAEDEGGKGNADTVVRSLRKKTKRLSLETRIAMRTNKEDEMFVPSRKGKNAKMMKMKILISLSENTQLPPIWLALIGRK